MIIDWFVAISIVLDVRPGRLYISNNICLNNLIMKIKYDLERINKRIRRLQDEI